jgi:hypothetical protein
LTGRAVPAALARALPAVFLIWPILALFATDRRRAVVTDSRAGSEAGHG